MDVDNTTDIEYKKILYARDYLRRRKDKIREIAMELSITVAEIKKLRTQSNLNELRVKQINLLNNNNIS